MSPIACPSPEMLYAFALGELPESELSEVAEHLDRLHAMRRAGRPARPGGRPDPGRAEAHRGSRAEDADRGSGDGRLGLRRRPSRRRARPGATSGSCREIGRGGMGIVYEAFQGSLNRHVALKSLHTRGDLARFRREARAAGRLHHTNIVPVHGVGEHDGRHYYVMQFIAGRGLDGACKERRWAAEGGRAAAVAADFREVARMASPGRRGPGLRTRPGGRPPRHQAVEHPARRAGHRLDHRLRPGVRLGRHRDADPHRRPDRDLALHGAGAVRRPRRRAVPTSTGWGSRSTSWPPADRPSRTAIGRC